MNIMVLMSSFNGENFLKEQLDSLLSQSYPCEKILIRDDGSLDKTTDILAAYSEKYPIIEWLKDDLGHLGIKGSYAVLYHHARLSQADYFLISDQDDIWLPEKIEKSLAKIETLTKAKPALVFSDVKIITEDRKILNSSFENFQKLGKIFPITLQKLLLYSPALGCTMIFNQALLQLTENAEMKVLNPDKWLLTLATLRGNIDYLQEPTLLYRQHRANAEGAMRGVRRRLFAWHNFAYLRAKYQRALDEAREILETQSVDENHRALLQSFIKLFTGNFFTRIICYFRFCLTPPHWKRKLGLFLSLFFLYQ